MRRQFVLPWALLFIALGVPSNAQSEAAAAAAAAGGEPSYYVVGSFHSLNCSVPAEAGSSYVWRKNGTLVEEHPELRGRYTLDHSVFKFTVRTNEDDYGNYSCAVGGAAPALTWELRGKPHAKLAPNTNVVEGQTLRLVCKVVGKPYPEVTWLVRNASDDDANLTDVRVALGERVKFNDTAGVKNSELLLEGAQRTDAGVYTCQPAGNSSVPAETVVRVKDMYAALWPFLGICAEVFVLCAIILVYEKRRTKPELDDSDTDNHEQKKS
ncbi:hypothetical protein PYW07_005471 [Mythimna separata]|uniref:Ig-like domain-containing protein n=1 Tax=Mythimna separata TaxID=271217 RepID=A0AAD8DRB5_MYTSE|nr:hypothetical protein PYW07_005471 [Mythimna separata]